jgi:hypothetical protein
VFVCFWFFGAEKRKKKTMQKATRRRRRHSIGFSMAMVPDFSGVSFLQSRSFHLTRPVCVEWLDNASNVVRIPQYQGVFDWQDLLDKSSADIQHLKVFTDPSLCSAHAIV